MHGNLPKPGGRRRKPDCVKTRLSGERVVRAEPLQQAFDRGFFYYQFCAPGLLSRIMRCDNLGELQWLKGQVNSDNPVTVRPY